MINICLISTFTSHLLILLFFSLSEATYTFTKLLKNTIYERSCINQIRSAYCNFLNTRLCTFCYTTIFFIALSQLSDSTSSVPDQITYSLLTYLFQYDLQFLLDIFNPSGSTYTFPSARNQPTTIPIFRSGKPFGSLSSYVLSLSHAALLNSSKEWYL